MSWYKTSQTGEWWIINGQAIYANSDIGDIGHEGVVLDMVRSEIAEMMGVNLDSEYYDWDEVKQNCVDIYFENQDDENKQIMLNKWGVNDKQELIDKVPYDTDIFDSIAIEEGVEKKQIDVADNVTDPRGYGMKELGWKRVIQDNIQTWTLTPDDLHNIFNGIDDIIGDFAEDNADDSEFNIEVMATGKMYYNVPYSVIADLNPMKLREYELSYGGAYARNLNWYKLAILVDKGEGPEETYVQCMTCNRFATIPSFQSNNVIWKTIAEMDEQEKVNALKGLQSFNQGLSGVYDLVGVSTGMCPECKNKFMQQIEDRKKAKKEEKAQYELV